MRKTTSSISTYHTACQLVSPLLEVYPQHRQFPATIRIAKLIAMVKSFVSHHRRTAWARSAQHRQLLRLDRREARPPTHRLDATLQLL